MGVLQEAITWVSKPSVHQPALAIGGAVGGWTLKVLENWWRGRERYQAYVTWKTIDTIREPEDSPVLIVQSVHAKPINITDVRIRNGFRWRVKGYPFNSDDPDYPNYPIHLEPNGRCSIPLEESVLERAAAQSRWLIPFLVPRVYVSVKTMGRGRRLFQAETGLKWSTRRARYRQ